MKENNKMNAFTLKPILLEMKTTNELYRYTGNTLELSHSKAHLQQIPIYD